MYNMNILKLVFPGVLISNIINHDKSNVMASCESCGKSKSCEVEGSVDTDGCEYESATREEVLKRIAICMRQEYGDDSMKHNILNNLVNIAITKYDISLADLNRAKLEYKPCEECEGTGVTISADIATCCSCKGSGLSNTDYSGSQRIWFLYVDMPYHEFMQFYTEEEYLELKPSQYGSSFFYIDKDININTDTFVLFNKRANRIVTTGTYGEVHDYLNIPYFVDINEALSNTYDFVLEKDFYNKYDIVPKDNIAEMQLAIITYVLDEAVSNASYGGADELLRNYVNKYPTIDSIKENLLVHISDDNTVYIEEILRPVTFRIIADFKLIGIELTNIQAANIVDEILGLIDKESLISLSKHANMIGVYIAEVICISKEYGNLA